MSWSYAKRLMARCHASSFGGSRPSFTLIELLAVIAIIVILTTLMLITMRGAERDSLNARTMATIMKINEVMENRMEEYVNRSMPLALPDIAFQINSQPGTLGFGKPFVSPAEMSRVRLIAIRDLMRLELPDRPFDLLTEPVPITLGIQEDDPSTPIIETIPNFAFPTTPTLRVGLPARTQAMRDRVIGIQSYLDTSPADTHPPGYTWYDQFSNEELLYLVVEQSTVNGTSALELFKNADIIDSDNDQLKEFADAWGRPIRWIRWPSGYCRLAPNTSTSPALHMPEFQGDPLPQPLFPTESSEVGADPIDFAMADWGNSPLFQSVPNHPFRAGVGLFPLIVSAGPDGYFGLRFQLHDLKNVPGTPNITDVSNDTYGYVPTAGGNKMVWTPSNVPILPAAYNSVSYEYHYPDPYHPRGPMRVDPVSGSPTVPNLWYRLGYPVDHVLRNTSTAEFMSYPSQNIAGSPIDNVTNLDEGNY